MKQHNLFYEVECSKGDIHYAYFHCVWDMSYLSDTKNILFLYNLEDYRDNKNMHTISFGKLEKIMKKEEPEFSKYMGLPCGCKIKCNLCKCKEVKDE